MNIKEIATRSYQLKINYAETKKMSIGSCMNSPPFKVGGHKWRIGYYPRGFESDKGKWIAFSLELVSDSVDVKACFSLTLSYPVKINRSLGRNSRLFPSVRSKQSFRRFVEVKLLEESELTDDILELEGKISVSDDSIQDESKICLVGVSPFDLHEQIGEIWKRRDNTDVAFEVSGEIFHAHRLVLSARSPVFRAELSGSMVEGNSKSIKIEEMNASDFEALLHFIYTDMLPRKCFQRDEDRQSVMSLFSVADRYDVQGLRIMCEKKLTENITLENVMETIDFAERHHCMKFKKTCLKYIALSKNFVNLAVTEPYFSVIFNHPTLLEELQKARKKQRTN